MNILPDFRFFPSLIVLPAAQNVSESSLSLHPVRRAGALSDLCLPPYRSPGAFRARYNVKR